MSMDILFLTIKKIKNTTNLTTLNDLSFTQTLV
jgi:hypothetical protein